MLRSFPPMLSVKSYVYVFNSFLSWLFVYGARERLNFILLDVDTQSSPSLPSSFVEETILSPLCILDTLVENQLAVYMWVYFWRFYSVPLVSLSILQYV